MILINTSLGKIAVYQKIVASENTPIIFLHGLFFDYQLWNFQVNAIKDRSVYTIDMPLHGNSKAVKSDWDLENCATMLLEILATLEVDKIHAVGHSWGGMIILRAAESHPYKFETLSLFNTPFESYSSKEVRRIKLQNMGLLFKKVYIKKASQSLFAEKSLQNNPNLLNYLSACMRTLSNRSVRFLNKIVRINADDKSASFQNLKVKYQVVVAKEDAIAGTPPAANIVSVDGGHTTPLEYPDRSLEIILSILKNPL